MDQHTKDLYYSQEGMERTLRLFIKYQNDMVGTMNQIMGIEFHSCDFETKTANFILTIQEWMRNPGGVMHGGAVASALDIAMGSNTCYWAGCKLTPTVTLQMNFLRPIPVGSRLLLTSRVHATGRTAAYATVFGLMDGRADRSVLTGSGVYHVPGDEGIVSDVLSAAMAEMAEIS